MAASHISRVVLTHEVATCHQHTGWLGDATQLYTSLWSFAEERDRRIAEHGYPSLYFAPPIQHYPTECIRSHRHTIPLHRDHPPRGERGAITSRGVILSPTMTNRATHIHCASDTLWLRLMVSFSIFVRLMVSFSIFVCFVATNDRHGRSGHVRH